MDLENCKIFVNQGKGSKDRYVLFGKSFATALRTHIAAHPAEPLAVPDPALREVQHAAGAADRSSCMPSGLASRRPRTPSGIRQSPGLTKNSGLADAELQLITGHSQRTSLAIYQHVAVDGQLADRYQQAMKDVGL